jgi:hypothetical protein
VFAEPDLRRTFVISVLGRLPIGLTGLAVLLLGPDENRFIRARRRGCCVLRRRPRAHRAAPRRAIDRVRPAAHSICERLLFPRADRLVGAVERTRSAGAVFRAAAGATFPPITVCVARIFDGGSHETVLAAAYSRSRS